MRKFSILLSLSILAAMILAACGGAGTSTSIPTQNVPPITAEVTGTSVSGTATEAPTEAATEAPTTGTPGTPGIPVTGATNPARVSSQLTFAVQTQDGTQVGNVKDEVLDFDNTRVAYVVVDANGRQVLVPWSSLTLQAGTSSGEQGVFILNADQNTFNNAPDFDLSTLPQMGQSASGWDTQISSYWQNGGTGTGTSSATATAGTGTGGTGTGSATATAGTGTGGTGTGLATATAGTGTGLATATAGTGTGGTGTGTGTGTGAGILQGVALATDVLGSTVTIGMQGNGTGTGTGSGTGTGQATATAGTGTGGTGTGSATATAGTGTGSGTGSSTSTPATGTGTGTGTTATVEDIVVDTATGDMMYLVLNTNAGNNQLIPVPLSMFGWDNTMQGLVLNADASMLQNAPGFASDQFPDTTTSGWSSQFDAFWQNNGAGGTGTGSGSGTQTTATATP